MNCYMLLGNKSSNGKASSDMRCRAVQLCNILADVPSARVILSGACGEAQLMDGLLRTLLPADVYSKHIIELDSKSTNTILSVELLTTINAAHKYIVTSDYHTRRVRVIAKKLQCNCTCIGSATVESLFGKVLLEILFCGLTRLLPLSVCRKLSKIRKELHLK